MRSLPFVISDLHGGFMKVEGILRVEEAQLVFEFQKKDDVFEVFQSALKSEAIPLSEIAMTEYRKGLFSDKLILHGRRASSFRELPGKDLIERVLKIKKKYRNLALSISSNMNLKLSEIRLKELGE